MSRFLALPLLALIACGTPAEIPEATPSAPETQAKAPSAETPAEPASPARTAVVVETVSTEKYTFAKMDACGQEAWVAGPIQQFEKGQTLQLVGGMGMANFESETLGRSFEEILFVDSWSVSDTAMNCGAMLPPPPEDLRIGEVREVQMAGKYVYVRMDVCGEEVWIATTYTHIKEGVIAATPIGHEMTQFKSPSTGVTFDSIYFVDFIKKSRVPPYCG